MANIEGSQEELKVIFGITALLIAPLGLIARSGWPWAWGRWRFYSDANRLFEVVPNYPGFRE